MSERKQQIQEMLRSDPTDIFLRYGLAMEHVSEGDDAGAIDCFCELLRLTPDYLPAYLQLGHAYLRQGASDDAKERLRAGIELARGQNEGHAADEMTALLDSLS